MISIVNNQPLLLASSLNESINLEKSISYNPKYWHKEVIDTDLAKLTENQIPLHSRTKKIIQGSKSMLVRLDIFHDPISKNREAFPRVICALQVIAQINEQEEGGYNAHNDKTVYFRIFENNAQPGTRRHEILQKLINYIINRNFLDITNQSPDSKMEAEINKLFNELNHQDIDALNNQDSAQQVSAKEIEIQDNFQELQEKTQNIQEQKNDLYQNTMDQDQANEIDWFSDDFDLNEQENNPYQNTMDQDQIKEVKWLSQNVDDPRDTSVSTVVGYSVAAWGGVVLLLILVFKS